MSDRKVFSDDDVVSPFEKESAPLADKFWIHKMRLSVAEGYGDPRVNAPGVYVHWREDLGVIRVGKS